MAEKFFCVISWRFAEKSLELAPSRCQATSVDVRLLHFTNPTAAAIFPFLTLPPFQTFGPAVAPPPAPSSRPPSRDFLVFGGRRKKKTKKKSFAVSTPQAWLRLDTMVVEKTDYLTGRNVRYLRVDTPDLPSSQHHHHHHQEGGIAPGAGGAGTACTPPPRETGDGVFSNGGSGAGAVGGSADRRSGHGGKKAPLQGPTQNGWAPPSVPTASHVGISPDRLFGETTASATAS